MPKKLDWKRINPSADLRYLEPRSSGSHDGFSVRVECKDPDTGTYQPLIFQGPKLRLPFGCEGKNTPSGIKYYCPMSFPTVKKENGSYTVDSQHKDALGFMNFLKDIDETNKHVAALQCKSWFKKEISPAVLEEFYYANLSTPKEEEKYSPSFQSKLKHNGTEFLTEFWNQKRERITYDNIVKGLTVIPLIETRGLWFAGKSFGMSFQVVQLMVFERDQFVGCAIDFGTPEKPLSIDLPQETEEGEPTKKRRRTTKTGTAVSDEFNLQESSA